SSSSTTCIGFPASYPCPGSGASSVTPAPWLSPCSAVEKTRCGVCGQEYHSHDDKRPRRVRDLSCGDQRVSRAFHLRRVQCSRCGGVKNEGLDGLADHPLDTKR